MCLHVFHSPSLSLSLSLDVFDLFEWIARLRVRDIYTCRIMIFIKFGFDKCASGLWGRTDSNVAVALEIKHSPFYIAIGKTQHERNTRRASDNDRALTLVPSVRPSPLSPHLRSVRPSLTFRTFLQLKRSISAACSFTVSERSRWFRQPWYSFKRDQAISRC